MRTDHRMTVWRIMRASDLQVAKSVATLVTSWAPARLWLTELAGRRCQPRVGCCTERPWDEQQIITVLCSTTALFTDHLFNLEKRQLTMLATRTRTCAARVALPCKRRTATRAETDQAPPDQKGIDEVATKETVTPPSPAKPQGGGNMNSAGVPPFIADMCL